MFRASSSVIAFIGRFFKDRRGNVAIFTALAAPVLVGAVGLGVEVADWYLIQRDMQNAANSAVLAAATNGGDTYADEAKAVAARYGFADGVDYVSVVASNTAACPAGGNNCYSVTITGSAPLFFSQIVGYRGTVGVTANGGQDGEHGLATRRTQISAVAIADEGTVPREYCILTLGTSGVNPSLRTNGAPKSDLGRLQRHVKQRCPVQRARSWRGLRRCPRYKRRLRY